MADAQVPAEGEQLEKRPAAAVNAEQMPVEGLPAEEVGVAEVPAASELVAVVEGMSEELAAAWTVGMAVPAETLTHTAVLAVVTAVDLVAQRSWEMVAAGLPAWADSYGLAPGTLAA